MWSYLHSTYLHYRRYEALYVSKHIFGFDGEIDEIMGHTYLFLKEQLELSVTPPASGILHETIIGAVLNFCFHVFVLGSTMCFLGMLI